MKFVAWRTVVCCILMATGCNQSQPPPEKTGRSTFTVGLVQIGTLDPARASSESAMVILKSACDGLTALDPQAGDPRPALALGWESSADAKTFILKLRPKVKYQDGSNVDAESIRENLSRIVRPGTASVWAKLLRDVDGFEDVTSGKANHLTGLKVVDPTTIEISLDSPFSALPTFLAHPGLIPVSPRSGYTDPPACAGPYKIAIGANEKEWVINSQQSSRSKSDAYLRQGKGFAKVIRFKSFDTAQEAYDARISGVVDAAPVPEPRVAEAQAKGKGYLRQQLPSTTYLGFGLRTSATSDPRVRKAISLALDRLVIIDAAFADQRVPAVRWLPDDFGAAADSSACISTARKISEPDKAKGALKESGIDASATKLALFFDPSQFSALVVQAMQVQIKDVLGITIEPRALDGTSFTESVKDPKEGIWLLNNSVDLPTPDQLIGDLFHTDGRSNLIGFSDPVVDRHLDEGSGAVQLKDSRDLYIKAENAVCDKTPAIPLWHSVSNWSYNPGKIRFEGPVALDLFGLPVLRHAALT